MAKTKDAESERFFKIVGENIKKYRLIRNYSLEVLGEKIGVGAKEVQRYETGQNRIFGNVLTIIADALGITLKQLLEGTDAKVGDDDPIFKDIINLPILGFVPAGGPVMVEENIEGYIPFPKALLKNDSDFCLRVKGDSMEDASISDGDLILVHPQPTAENGQTVIARIDGEVTCKRFYIMADKVRLEPANHKYKPRHYSEVEIIGIVTKVIKEVF
jgi:repressor LexA